MARQVLLEPLAIPRAHIHRIEGERNDLDGAALSYEREIARVFGVLPDGPPPPFDLVLLGMGDRRTHCSPLSRHRLGRETSRWVDRIMCPPSPPTGVTMTPRLLNAARHVMFLVAGTEKADALALVLAGARDPQRLPAQMIEPTSGVVMCLRIGGAGARLDASRRPLSTPA